MTLKNAESMSETAFKNHVQRALKLLPNTWFVKTQERGRRGVPDELICLNGRFIALELKCVGGKLSRIQEETLKAIQRAGGIAAEVSPRNWGI